MSWRALVPYTNGGAGGTSPTPPPPSQPPQRPSPAPDKRVSYTSEEWAYVRDGLRAERARRANRRPPQPYPAAAQMADVDELRRRWREGA
jgi:hypothetical protein